MYILDYVFNPYPYVVEFLNHLSKISNMPVVFYGADVRTLGGDYRYVDNSIGPDGFVECFVNASFVVTTSFHGSAYSVNFEKDFFVVLNHTSSKDDRVKSFLASVGLENRGLLLPQLDISSVTVEDMKTDHTNSRAYLQQMRDDSREYLKEALDFAVHKIEGVREND